MMMKKMKMMKMKKMKRKKMMMKRKKMMQKKMNMKMRLIESVTVGQGRGGGGHSNDHCDMRDVGPHRPILSAPPTSVLSPF